MAHAGETVAADLRVFLRQQCLIVQKEISAHLQILQELAVKNVESSLQEHWLSEGRNGLSTRWAAASEQRGVTMVTGLQEQVMPMLPDKIPGTMPTSIPKELQILDVGDADATLTCEENSAVPLSVVPVAGMQTIRPVRDVLVLSETPPPLFEQHTTSDDGGGSDDILCERQGSKIRTSRRSRRQSKVHEVWKLTPRVSHSLRRTTRQNDLMEVVKAAVFAETETISMKDRMRTEILNPSSRASLKYKDRGLAGRIAQSDAFEIMTLLVILLNALWMAVDLDLNDATTLIDAHGIFIFMDNFFCTYFFAELLIRFSAYNRKKDCLTDAWFCFDSLLLLLMVIETWVMPLLFLLLDVEQKDLGNYGNASVLRVFRIVRLSKISRLAKLLHTLPELVTMVRGIKFAARTVFFCLCLIISVIYVSALVFREFTYDLDIGRKYFSSVPAAMATLLFQGTMPDVESFIQDVASGQIIVGILLVIFIFLTTFTLMNMIVGVLVAVVGEIAETERERRTVGFVKSELHKVFSCPEIDLNTDGSISEEEFETFLTHPLAIKALTSVGVDVLGLVDVSEFIFRMDGDGGLTFPELLELVLNFRGSNSATVKDVVDLRMFLTSEFIKIETRLETEFRKLKKPQSTCASPSPAISPVPDSD